MKQPINFYGFRQAFQDMGRGDQFSGEALSALYDFLEECESDLGEEYTLDVIALCCDFSEYDNLADYCEQYEPVDSIDEIDATVIPFGDDGAFLASAH